MAHFLKKYWRHDNTRKKETFWALIKWSVGSPSNPTIRIRFQLKS